MRVKSIVSLLILSILLAACASSTGTPPVVVTESPFIPAPATDTPLPYMPPAEMTPAPFEPAYPAPSTPSAGTPQIPPSGYEPQPGDENLKRDTVSLDKANSQLVITISDPVQAKAI